MKIKEKTFYGAIGICKYATSICFELLGSFRSAGELLLLIFSMIELIIKLISSYSSKVRILTQGGMKMLKHNAITLKSLLVDSWVVKAVLLVLGVWGALPQP